MPVPKPGKDESKDDFIGRCISKLHKTDPDRPDDQIIAMCFNSWRMREGVHVDFIKVLSDFIKIFGKKEGHKKYDEMVVSYKLDVSKPYTNQDQIKECWGGLCEAYNWAKPLIRYLKADKEAKYWKVRALTANVSMGPARADYTDLVELERAAPTLTWRPLNLNHDHSKTLPFPENRVDWAEYEDNAVECIIRIHNSQPEVQQALENGDIVNPSIEGEPRGGYRTKDGRRVPKFYNFTALALLEKGVTLPGVPATYGFEPLVFNESLGRSLAESLSMERDREEEPEMSEDEKGIEKQTDVAKLAEDMSEEEIKAKIADVQRQIDALPDTKTDPKYEILYAEMHAWKDALADLIKKKALGEAMYGMDICGQCKFFMDLSNTTETIPAVMGAESDAKVSITKGAIGTGVGRCSITEKLTRKNDSACTDARPREQATDLDRTKETIGEMVMKDNIRELEEKVLRVEQAKSQEIEDHVKTKMDLTEATDKITRVTQGLAVEQNKNVRLRESIRELTGKLEKASNTIPELEVRLKTAEDSAVFYKEANKGLEEKFEVQKKSLVEAKDEVTRVLIKTNEEATKRATAVQEAINAEQEKGRLSKEVAELTERIAELTREVSNTAQIRAETAKQNLNDQLLIKELREKDEEKTKTIRELKRRISKTPREIIIE